MDKTVVSLMCENIQKQSVDLDEMIKEDSEKVILFIHGQYEEVQRQLNHTLPKNESQS